MRHKLHSANVPRDVTCLLEAEPGERKALSLVISSQMTPSRAICACRSLKLPCQAVLRSATGEFDRQCPDPRPALRLCANTLSSQHLLVKHYNSVYPVTGIFLCFGCCCAPCCGQPGSCITPSAPQGDLVPAAASTRPAVAKADGEHQFSVCGGVPVATPCTYMWCSTQTAATSSAFVFALPKSQSSSQHRNIVSPSRG